MNTTNNFDDNSKLPIIYEGEIYRQTNTDTDNLTINQNETVIIHEDKVYRRNNSSTLYGQATHGIPIIYNDDVYTTKSKSIKRNIRFYPY